MGKVIVHKNVGLGLDEEEYHSDDAHELPNGEELPETASEGDLFLKTDEHRLYIYIEE